MLARRSGDLEKSSSRLAEPKQTTSPPPPRGLRRDSLAQTLFVKAGGGREFRRKLARPLRVRCSRSDGTPRAKRLSVNENSIRKAQRKSQIRTQEPLPSDKGAGSGAIIATASKTAQASRTSRRGPLCRPSPPLGRSSYRPEFNYRDPPDSYKPLPRLAHLQSCAASDRSPLMAAERTRFAQPEFFAF